MLASEALRPAELDAALRTQQALFLAKAASCAFGLTPTEDPAAVIRVVYQEYASCQDIFFPARKHSKRERAAVFESVSQQRAARTVCGRLSTEEDCGEVA